jgi:hypothetical protein
MPFRRHEGYRVDFDPLDLERPGVMFVYALYDGHFVKVGKSRWHPRAGRLPTLQTGSSRRLQLLAFDIYTTERAVHHRLRRHRVRGEVFRLCLDLLHEINRWAWLDVQLYDRLARQVTARRRVLWFHDIRAIWQ